MQGRRESCCCFGPIKMVSSWVQHLPRLGLRRGLLLLEHPFASKFDLDTGGTGACQQNVWTAARNRLCAATSVIGKRTAAHMRAHFACESKEGNVLASIVRARQKQTLCRTAVFPLCLMNRRDTSHFHRICPTRCC